MRRQDINSADTWDLWVWDQEQAARTLAKAFRGLGHKATADNWQREAERLKLLRKPKDR